MEVVISPMGRRLKCHLRREALELRQGGKEEGGLAPLELLHKREAIDCAKDIFPCNNLWRRQPVPMINCSKGGGCQPESASTQQQAPLSTTHLALPPFLYLALLFLAPASVLGLPSNRSPCASSAWLFIALPGSHLPLASRKQKAGPQSSVPVEFSKRNRACMSAFGSQPLAERGPPWCVPLCLGLPQGSPNIVYSI